MTALVIAMLLIVLVCAAVIVYVAYPHRGERMPVVPQLGDAMSKAVEQLPTVDQTTDWPAPAEPADKVASHRS